MLRDRGERVAVLKFMLPLGWHWKTIEGEGHHARFRRALGEALRNAPTAGQARDARERAASQRTEGPYSAPRQSTLTNEVRSGLASGQRSENV